MISEKDKKTYYQALLERNKSYDGLFFVGVKTTGIFCHASCPARKPKYENCDFFLTAKDALLASFRPCERCKPILPPNQAAPIIEKLIKAVENNPTKRWKDQDFREIGVDQSTARRQFKKRFNMTFIEYARSRRMGMAMKQIKNGESIIEAQLESGYESASGFRDAFSKIMGDAPTKSNVLILKATWLDTPLGPMIAIVDEKFLYLLEFTDRRGLEKEIERLRKRMRASIIPGKTKVTDQIKDELAHYFEGQSFKFKTPLYLLGSDFQKQAWHQLQQIKPGDTKSYGEIAQKINKAKAYRAVAQANGTNQIAIVIPCHRVINSDGKLGGYAGGLSRKEWLINHEKNHIK